MISIILGTRPEIIKMSPIIRASQALGEAYLTLHTGQHYSYEMDRAFFEDPEFPHQNTILMSVQASMPNRLGGS